MDPRTGVRDEPSDRRTARALSEREADRLLATLGDGDCRAVLRQLADGPQTAEELAEGCEIPSTTLYRKLDDLVASGLVAEGTKVSTGGRNASLYRHGVDGVEVDVGQADGLDVRVTDRARDPPDRSDVGDGTDAS
ncbi:ArsR/SmtB family transcription factor [Halobaculum sp. EA56]|uniref:ArsR/SmtB family transcription factor n=1 Tax=Halobaculum sp. EA56 TaxID=3421648 RepID=UPI003EC00BB0